MDRRYFMKAGAAAAALAVGAPAMAKMKNAPDHLPILNKKLRGEDYTGKYDEREITAPVDLCDKDGLLNPNAMGWSRVPLQRCNLSGHWPHKKRWNYWCFISDKFAFSFNPIQIDYLGHAVSAFLIDFTTNKRIAAVASTGFGNRNNLPEEVEKDVSFDSKKIKLSMINREDGIKVNFKCKSLGGRSAEADFTIHKPKGHETLNVVIPWTRERFQFTSKQNTLPVEGSLTVGDEKFVMDPMKCHGVMDFGRGMWPYHTYWNWGAITGVQGSDVIGLNLGAKWTTGTGANENGICYNGRLTKIMEDLLWEYDVNDWMKPWRVRSVHSDIVDLTLKPSYVENTGANMLLIGTHAAVAFGKWSGTLKFENKTIEIADLVGWGEELRWKW